MSWQACLRDTGIASPESLDAVDAEIASWQELRLIRNIVHGLGAEPGLGVRAGLRYHLPVYGLAGLAAMTSPTLGHSIELGLRLRALAFGFHRPVVERGPRSVAITLPASRVPDEVARFVLERDMATWVVLVRDFSMRSSFVRRIEFSFPSAGARGVYQRLFEEDVTFGGRRNAVALHKAALERPLPHANRALSRRYERQCLQLVERRRADGGVAGQVRALLRAAEGKPPSCDAVAHELFIGVRTLRRQLAAEGTSFRALLAEARVAYAERLLLGTSLTVEQIARQLGYSEPAAFVRAFRRWRGNTPAAFRDGLPHR